MKNYNFTVRGSSGNQYQVNFQIKDSNLLADCECRAAEQGQSCKHRINILKGDISDVISANSDEISSLLSTFQETRTYDIFLELESLEKKKAEIESLLKSKKKEFAKHINGQKH